MIHLAALVLSIFLGIAPSSPIQAVSDPAHVHLHAGFQVYQGNTRADFTDIRYIYFMPCGLPDDQISTIQDKIHLHDQVGDVAHIHAAGITWRNLFESLQYDIPSQGRYFLGEQEVPNLLDQPIQGFASASFFFGDTTDIPAKLQSRVTKERIEEIDKKTGENCGSAEPHDHASTPSLAA